MVCVCLVAQSCLSLCDPMDPTRLLSPWDSAGKNTGVGSHSLLQGIFLTQGLNLSLLHCRQILCHLSHQGRFHGFAAATAKSRQLCPTLCDPIDTGVGCHFLLQCMKVKSKSEVSQSCLTLCDPMDCSPPGSSTHGIFQARVLGSGKVKTY